MKKRSNFKLIKSFLPYFKKYKWILVLDLFCASLTTLCELILPLIVREITGAVSETMSLTASLIIKCAVLYIVLRIIDTAANYYMSSVGHIMGTKIETDMRHDLFGHLQKLSFSYYDNTKTGTLMSRITSDLFDVTEFAHHCPEEFFIAGINAYIATRRAEYAAPNRAIGVVRSVEARIAYIRAKKPMMTRTGARNFFMAIEFNVTSSFCYAKSAFISLTFH